MHSTMRQRLANRALVGVAAAALALPAAAHAADAAAASDAPNASVEEVVVTAQRRDELLKDVPLTVQVSSGEDMKKLGLTSTRDLTETTPGLIFGLRGATAQPAIRGVTTQGSGPGVENNVAIYLDGIYMPETFTNVFDLADVDHVEVLKGPQGTLFGRNSTGGAIRIFTEQPSFDAHGRASVGYGSYDDFRASVFATGPIVEGKLAGSIAADYHTNDGYVDDVVHGGHWAPVDARTLRAKLLFTPTENTRFTLTGMVLRDSDPTAFAVQALNGDSLARLVVPGVLTPQDPRRAALNFAIQKTDAAALSLTGEVDTSAGKFTSLTSTLYSHFIGDLDADGSPFDALDIDGNTPDLSFTQELTFASKQMGRFNFLLGAFGFYDNAKYNPAHIVAFGGASDSYTDIKTHAYAGFGELDFDITDRLKLTGGLRYSWEQKEYSGSVNNPVPAFIGKHDWDALTPRVSLTYKLDENSNLYATYSQGFTSGSYAPTAFSNVPFNPETVKSYEAGFKTAQGRFNLNASGFYYDYDDMQVAVIQGTHTAIQNAAKARVYGLDLDGALQVTDDFRLKGSLEALHAEFTRFPNASVNVPRTACPPGGAPCGDVTAMIDATGNQLPKAPDLTSSLTAEYSHAAFGGKLVLSGTWYHNSGFPWDAGDRIKQPAYDTLAASVAWSPASDRFRIMVWGRNLTNADYYLSEFDSAGGDLVAYAPPRWFGVTLDVNF